MMLLSYKLRRDLRLRRRIASLMAFCFVWFSCLGNFGHSHGGGGTGFAKGQASKALSQTLNSSSNAVLQVSNAVQSPNTSDHCAMCDWLNLAVAHIHSSRISATVSLTRMEVPTFSVLPVSLRLAILGGRAPPTV